MAQLKTSAALAAAKRAAGLRWVPTAVLVALVEVGAVTREHLAHLTPHERRRLLLLVGRGRARPSNLAASERRELSELMAKLEPRLLAGEAVERISPVPLPGRLLYGRGKRPRPR